MSGTCMDCKGFKGNCSFESRDEMIPYINLIKEASIKNKINIIDPDEQYQNSNKDLAGIGSEPPYPDIIFYKFACINCGKIYRVFLDWYHGKGESKLI